MKKLDWAVNGFKVFRDIIRGVVVIFHNKLCQKEVISVISLSKLHAYKPSS